MPRVVLNPATHDGIKTKMPTACASKYINIQKDLLNQSRYVATYDHKHSAAQAEIPQEKMESLPGRLSGMSKQSRWGHGGNIAVDEAIQREHLEMVLRWAWDKHMHFFGGVRPTETVVVDGELAL